MNTLAGMVSGIVRSGKCQMRAMGKKAPDKSKVESRSKRFTRYVQNEQVNVQTYYLPFIIPLLVGLARCGSLVLVMDGSEVGRGCLALVNREKGTKEPAEPPYKPLYHHQYWFIDIRYLVNLEGKWVYSICIIEGVSRTILAGMASRYQDELAILQLLHAAFGDYGLPWGIVSDNGSVFTAEAFLQWTATLISPLPRRCPGQSGSAHSINCAAYSLTSI